MRLIPVLDVMNGVVVRGVGGRRSRYRPIVSQLTSSTEPMEVAKALFEACQPREMYLADLDAIQGKSPRIEIYKRIIDLGIELWVDAGINDIGRAQQVADAGCHVIAGLETIPLVDALRDLVEAVGADRTIFSLDLRDGVPLPYWPIANEQLVQNEPTEADKLSEPKKVWWPMGIAKAAAGCGIQRLIVLDLARVGVGNGTGTEELCRKVASTYPHVEVIAGGGVNGVEDLHRLKECGVRGVLVASSLHDKRLPAPTTEY